MPRGLSLGLGRFRGRVPATDSELFHRGGFHMALKISKAEVWAGDIADQPGGLSDVLQRLGDAGARLECVIARRQEHRPGRGVVFVTPVRGKRVQDAARAMGLSPAQNIATLRLEGPDAPGAGGKLSRAVADLGVNVRGVSAMTMGKNFVAYI